MIIASRSRSRTAIRSFVSTAAIKPAWIGWRLLGRRQVHVFRHRLHVQIDRDAVLGSDVGEQEMERMIRSSVLIRRASGVVLGGHLAEADHTFAEQLLGALLHYPEPDGADQRWQEVVGLFNQLPAAVRRKIGTENVARI